MSTPETTQKRPLSPHLQVYRLPLTALMSISHRATGAALAIGTLLVLSFFLAAAAGEEIYDIAMRCATSTLGQITLFLWSAALYFHMCNGIRHMIWDTGRLLEKGTAMKANYVVIAAAIILTASTWYCALNY